MMRPVPFLCRRRRAAGLCLACCAILLRSLAAGEAPREPSRLTVEAIFGKGEFKTEDAGPARWLKDGSGYTTLEAADKSPEARDVVRHNPASGRREVLVPADRLVPPGQTRPLRIEGYAWSDDTRRLLVFTNTQRVWRQNTRGDYWVFDRQSGKLDKLGGQAEPATLMFATFSPPGNKVAYVCRNNLYVQNLDDGQVIALTRDGSETIINGTADWVYEEEFELRNGFRWSPDGQHLAYWRFDTSGVPRYSLINYTDGLYPKLTAFPYPKAGQTNAACRVGIVASGGGATRWCETGADPRNYYIPELDWAPDSRTIVFQQLNRLQNENRVFRGAVAGGATTNLYTDRDNAWLDVMPTWHWLKAGEQFLWLSERDGWRHLYVVSRSGATVTLLTPGAYDVISIAGVDEQRGSIYLIASPDNPTQRYLHRVPLDGSGKLERLSPANQPGTHAYDLSPDCRWAFHTYSRFGQPPVRDVVGLPNHDRVRTLAENAALRTKLGRLEPWATEFFRVDIGDRVQLDAWCIKPAALVPSHRYPLLVHVYGEPAAQTVVDAWGGDTYLWHGLLAQQGYLVMSLDNRGTPAPRGRDWRKCVYRQIGILSSADQAAGVRRILRERPYVDPQRIGVWGWSGGGSMTLNALFRYPDLYRTGMAIAFVSNERFYDTIYQERYMGLPADNETGYRDGSALTFAHQLQGQLLLVHGTGDDNCHYQNCEVLINELIKHNKPFSLMTYPNRTHSIDEGPNTRRHLFETLTRYLHQNLPPGPTK